MPHPDVLAKYEKVYPGAAAKIFQMAEEQAHHRRKMDSENLKFAARDSLLGIIFGFIITIGVIIVGLIIAYLNPESAANAISGGFLSGASLIAIVRIFVTGSKRKSKNDKESE